MITETIDRTTWEAMLDRLDGDTQRQLRAELAQWASGESCERITFRPDSFGRLNGQSCPHPAFTTMPSAEEVERLED